MSKEFVVDKIYRCTSVCGVTPCFADVECGTHALDLFDMAGVDVYIVDSGKKYLYWEKVVTFKPESLYRCVDVNPLTFEGKVYVPATMPLDYVEHASDVIQQILKSHQILVPKSVTYTIINILEFTLSTSWDKSVDSMYEILSDWISRYVEPFKGSWNGASRFRIEKDIMLSIMLPREYCILMAMDNMPLPDKVEVEWSDNEQPVLRFQNGESFLDWFNRKSAPIEER